jgi:hypothetical protein
VEGHPEIAYVGLNVADTPDDAESFVERYDWTWQSMQDPERQRARTLGATYQPHFILLDATGDIVDTWEGGGGAGVWEAMLAKLP